MLGISGDAVDFDADPLGPGEQMCCPNAVNGRDAHSATPLSGALVGGGKSLGIEGLVGRGGGGGAGLGSVVTASSWMSRMARSSSLISLSNGSECP